MSYKIYHLIGGESDIFYVGMTKNRLSLRLIEHKSAVKSKRSGNGLKNRKILEHWDSLRINQIDAAKDYDEALRLEKMWIKRYLNDGLILHNAESTPKSERIIDETGFGNVKMRKSIGNLLRKNKEITEVPVTAFIEMAVIEKLEREGK